MTATVGDTIEWSGRPARIARRKYGPDNPHPRDTEGEAWDAYPLDGDGWWVVEYLQGQIPDAEEPAPSPAPDAATPDAEERETAPEPVTGAEPPPKRGEKGLKFRYEKALRGRIGNGPEQLTPAEFVLLVMLLTYADENLCNARPGGARLAADCGLTGSTAAKRATERAGDVAAKGFAVITRRGTNTGGNAAQTYRLKVPEWP